MNHPVVRLVAVTALVSVPVGVWQDRSVRAQSGVDAAGAFSAIASVLSSPRCANCHVTGDAPLNGEEGRPHPMNVRRGTDGRGTPAMRCTNCHQETSSSVLHQPPGGPDWRLPPPATPMAWRGLSPGDQCRILTDRTKNGGRGLAELVEHVTNDRLVQASWRAGPGRPVPPISHEAFVRRFQEWIETGAQCPQ